MVVLVVIIVAHLILGSVYLKTEICRNEHLPQRDALLITDHAYFLISLPKKEDNKIYSKASSDALIQLGISFAITANREVADLQQGILNDSTY